MARDDCSAKEGRGKLHRIATGLLILFLGHSFCIRFCLILYGNLKRLCNVSLSSIHDRLRKYELNKRMEKRLRSAEESKKVASSESKYPDVTTSLSFLWV